jgi:hypothetical protein
MRVLSFGSGLLEQCHDFVVRCLLDSVRFTGSTRLVALDVVARQEDAVAGEDFSRFNKSDVTNKDLFDVDNLLHTVTNNLDTSFVLALVENLELPLLLPVVQRPNDNLRKVRELGHASQLMAIRTTIATAAKTAIPSTHSTGGSWGPGPVLGVTAWTIPRTNEIAAAIQRRIYHREISPNVSEIDPEQ